VLDVAHMLARAPCLGDDVTVIQVPDGVHDLALSGEAARRRFFAEMLAWTDEHVPVARAHPPAEDDGSDH
jgi:alpha-beta hydrolase superfamily lysophospholipase